MTLLHEGAELLDVFTDLTKSPEPACVLGWNFMSLWADEAWSGVGSEGGPDCSSVERKDGANSF